MFTNARLLSLLLLWPLLFFRTVAISAQQPVQPGTGKIILDVVVTAKSGPVSGLHQEDFTLLDNKAPKSLASFEAVDGRQAPIEVLLVVDAVNAPYQSVSYEREQVDKFLRADQGKLDHATTLAVLTDTGLQIHQSSSVDGNELSGVLDQSTIGLREVRRQGGFYAADEIYQTSLVGLRALVAREAQRSGRKVILWISPGWPLLSGPNVRLDSKEQQRLFADIVDYSNQFSRDRITLYSVDPLGTADAGIATVYWRNFLKGVANPGQVQLGDLGLQVLAAQSGGLALAGSNDIAGQLQKCVADLGIYYELSFDPTPSEKPNEYHNLSIRMAKPGLTARTLQGYYSQP